MIDHEGVIKAMNTKQILINQHNTPPIKNILEVLMTNPVSHFNSKLKESLYGPAENHTELMSNVNSKLLMKDLTYLQQDRLAKYMLLKEK